MRADTFRAMGSDAHVYVVGGPDHLVADARARIGGLEARWSRFVPTSEISQLNATGGATALVVSAETIELIERGRDAWRLTAGRFDPTVLGDVLRAGYTASFEELTAARRAGANSRLTRGCGGIEVDPVARTVRFPSGVGFDPGGIGKGLAADLVVRELLAAGADGACVNLGGDVRAAGVPPETSWAIAIEHPTRPEPAAVVQLRDGAVATSSRLHRRWTSDRGPVHHLIDPSCGVPSAASLWTATAIAATGWQAEALAKARLPRRHARRTRAPRAGGRGRAAHRRRRRDPHQPFVRGLHRPPDPIGDDPGDFLSRPSGPARHDIDGGGRPDRSRHPVADAEPVVDPDLHPDFLVSGARSSISRAGKAEPSEDQALGQNPSRGRRPEPYPAQRADIGTGGRPSATSRGRGAIVAAWVVRSRGNPCRVGGARPRRLCSSRVRWPDWARLGPSMCEASC